MILFLVYLFCSFRLTNFKVSAFFKLQLLKTSRSYWLYSLPSTEGHFYNSTMRRWILMKLCLSVPNIVITILIQDGV